MLDLNSDQYNRPFLINGYVVDPLNNKILHNGKESIIEQKMMQVLVCLAHNQEKVVSREELMDFAWPEVYVTEETLTRCISLLRKSFEDRAHRPEVIKTVRNRGYQMITPVRFLDEAEQNELRKAHSYDTWIRNRKIIIPTLTAVLLLVIIGTFLVSRNRPGPPVLPNMEMPLTTLQGLELYPHFSPDGASVSFAWSGPDQQNWDIYVMPIDNKSPVNITRTPEQELGSAWSPDGTTLAFIRNDSSKSGIYLVATDGKNERKIADRAITYRSSLDWSPGGEWIAFADSANSRASTGIFLVSPETGERKQLTTPSRQHWGDYDPSFSPDGKFVAFTSSVSMGNRAIFILNLETGEERRLTFEPLQIRGHTWSNDGKFIIYSSDAPKLEALWAINVKSGRTHWLEIRGRYPMLSTDGSKMTVERQLTDVNIWKYPLDETQPGAVDFNSTHIDQQPVYSADGQIIAFVSTRTGFSELWMKKISSNSLVQLTHFNGMSITYPQWSPDGNFISFNGFTKEGNADVFIVDLQSRNVRRVTDEKSNEVYPSWSPDSRMLYFGSNRSGAWHIWRTTITGQDPEMVTHSNGYAGHVSPNNQFLYFTRFDTGGVWMLDIANPGSSPEPVIEDFSTPSPFRWTLNGDQVIYLRQMDHPEEDYELLQYHRGGNKPSLLSRIPYQSGITSFALHPTGNTILMSQIDLNRIDIHLYIKE